MGGHGLVIRWLTVKESSEKSQIVKSEKYCDLVHYRIRFICE